MTLCQGRPPDERRPYLWAMEKRHLGKSPLKVAPLMLGGNVFGWTADETASFAVLDAFVEAGYDFIDTADVYSRWIPGHHGGESESMIGKWLQRSKKRNKITLATKVGAPMGTSQTKNLKKDYILQEVEASLKRLQTDHIDLYQSHWDDLETPVEEPLQAYATLIKAGKVRVIGASNFSAERLQAALKASETQGLPRYESLQPMYNLMEREGFEKDLLAICENAGLGVLPYYSLASGFLTGKYRTGADLNKSPRGAGVKKYLTPKGLAVLHALDEISDRRNTDQTAVALAWLLTRPTITAPLASATSAEQVKSLIKGAQLKLHPEDIVLLDESSVWGESSSQI